MPELPGQHDKKQTADGGLHQLSAVYEEGSDSLAPKELLQTVQALLDVLNGGSIGPADEVGRAEAGAGNHSLLAEGKYKTSHYAISTGFMALGMMLPGMASGWIQEQIGYQHFFIWVMICCIPLFIVLPFLRFKKK